MSEPMRISPNYNVDDWNKLQPLPDGAWEEHEGEWRKGIDIFEDRYRGRFLNIIDAIENYKCAGFAVMALDCLLVETLEQFWQGVKQTPFRKSGKYFENFLTRTSFRKYFDTPLAQPTQEEPTLAIRFYKQIRCGILHQAQVLKSSRIRIRMNEPLVSESKDQRGLIINRSLFHQRLKRVFDEYVLELQDPTKVALRQNFKKKMEYVCSEVD